MTDVLKTTRSSQQSNPSSNELSPESLPARRWTRIQFWLYLAVTLVALVFLLWPNDGASRGDPPQAASTQESPVRLTEPGLIQIAPESPLHKKMQTTSVRLAKLAEPVLTVTGTVVASLRPGKRGAPNWQFSSPEILTAYTDWQKAALDIGFARAQLDSIRQLADNRVAAQDALVKRLEKLVAAGTETEKDLAAAQTELLQAQIQGRKDLHEAQTAWRLAERAEAALSRQLQQEGLEPDLLRVQAGDVDIMVADVPETMLSRVKLGQGCEARFLGVDDRVFSGNVHSISPVLSKERRSLRVLFTISDPEDSLRPGMFADIGLGTDARDALLVPLAGVVHVGRSDFMLVRTDDASWRVTTVQVGELHDAAVEILDGLKAGDDVMGQGAILLKPFIVEASQRQISQGMDG